jgi:ABC-2 type transport system permease protein
MSDAFFWPSLNIVLWGVASRHFIPEGPGSEVTMLSLVAGIILWIFIWRGQYELSVNYLGELWDHNLPNIFIAPVRFGEWLVGLLLTGLVKSIIGVGFASVLAYVLYHANILDIGMYVIPFSLLLIMTGWAFGMFVTSIIMKWGTQVQTFAWIGVNIFSPFIPVFYPLDALPVWAQAVSRTIPATYVFESMRSYLRTGTLEPSELMTPTVLSVIYVVVGVFVMRRAFRAKFATGLITHG